MENWTTHSAQSSLVSYSSLFIRSRGGRGETKSSLGPGLLSASGGSVLDREWIMGECVLLSIRTCLH